MPNEDSICLKAVKILRFTWSKFEDSRIYCIADIHIHYTMTEDWNSHISFTHGREASTEYEPCKPVQITQRFSPQRTGLYTFFRRFYRGWDVYSYSVLFILPRLICTQAETGFRCRAPPHLYRISYHKLLYGCTHGLYVRSKKIVSIVYTFEHSIMSQEVNILD
jgi:hypothetical protein